MALTAIVNFLNTSTTGNVVLGDSKFKLCIVTQGPSGLYEAFAKGVFSNKYATVIILDHPCNNLRGRSTLLIDQHNDRHSRVIGTLRCCIGFGQRGDFTLGSYYCKTLLYKKIRHFDGFF